MKETVKKGFTTAWKWVKKNWVLVLVVAALGTLAWGYRSNDTQYKDLLKSYTQQNVDNQRQINELRAVQEQERHDREQIMSNYLDELHRIEREYKAGLSKIAEQSNTTQETIINNHNSDPTSLTEAVTNTFGIPVE